MLEILFLSFLLCTVVQSDKYYAIKPYHDSDIFPHYGNFSVFDTTTKKLSFLGSFTFDVHDRSDLYYFVGGPVAINTNLNLVYMSITGATAFQRLLLLAYNYKSGKFYQSRWIRDNGYIHFLYYDPVRNRLFGLRDNDTFTFYIEEYDVETLDVVKLYATQNGEQYAFTYGGCTSFDYNENWIVQVRTRFENPSVNAYWVKMDLNLVGKKDDIVTEFHLMPDVHNFLTMTYDIDKTKLVLGTWQHGSIELDVYMFHFDPKESGKFPCGNETLKLLFKTNGKDVQFMQDIWNPVTREVLFMLQTEDDETFATTNYMLRVQFDTLEILEKTKLTDDQLPLFELWQYFYLQSL